MLTDEELARYVDLFDPADPYPAALVGILARELAAHRAATLTAEEREALEWMRDLCSATAVRGAYPNDIERGHAAMSDLAIATLDRLLAAQVRK